MNTLDAGHYQKHSSFQKSVAQGLLSTYSFRGNEQVLDVGCGDGEVTAQIAMWVPRGAVKGIDPSLSMISFAKKQYSSPVYSNLSFEQAAAESEHGHALYDLITAFNCLHWVRDLAQAFRHIRRALKPEGRFIAVTYPKDSPYWASFFNLVAREQWKHLSQESACQSWLSLDEYKALIHQTGLQIIQYEEHLQEAFYSDKAALSEYIRGWLPCFASFSSEDEQQAFLSELVEDMWALNAGNSGCRISYLKLDFVLERGGVIV